MENKYFISAIAMILLHLLQPLFKAVSCILLHASYLASFVAQYLLGFLFRIYV